MQSNLESITHPVTTLVLSVLAGLSGTHAHGPCQQGMPEEFFSGTALIEARIEASSGPPSAQQTQAGSSAVWAPRSASVGAFYERAAGTEDQPRSHGEEAGFDYDTLLAGFPPAAIACPPERISKPLMLSDPPTNLSLRAPGNTEEAGTDADDEAISALTPLLAGLSTLLTLMALPESRRGQEQAR